jgi:hypothetical protein
MIAVEAVVMFARPALMAFIGPSLQIRTLSAESAFFFSFSSEGTFE